MDKEKAFLQFQVNVYWRQNQKKGKFCFVKYKISKWLVLLLLFGIIFCFQ